MSRARKRRVPSRQGGEQDATEQQKKFIRVLLRELVGAALQEDMLQKMGKRQAGSIIKQLQDVQAELQRIEELDRPRPKDRDETSAARARRAWLMAMTFWRW